jgi:hypothetical protein
VFKNTATKPDPSHIFTIQFNIILPSISQSLKYILLLRKDGRKERIVTEKERERNGESECRKVREKGRLKKDKYMNIFLPHASTYVNK